ncbi:selenocysteine-specific translation elongation factor [Fimbriiglobus ruber]|uniref:Selenocysteine-specific elongation factor n=1 Tax=Fimbriiglobus ruber TaxID=1908690 RepID=A0A225E934_9BACT|nr:selenocysteine-specific translation elongation factor [Fimbriiglobus ruber]OWK47268.1 Selenocysteine-specific translation elongation factor [Fimbriiglobus ruber]
MPRDLILGTAGHIDHGKTSLVRALTGIDCDRLPEEKARGITIDIGFAHLDLGPFRLGIVDVPGHERFIKNMLAGATGMDLAMLVVAADDSVMPQTREHLEILRLLGLKHGVVVLTKADLVDDTTREVVVLEIQELIKGTFLEQAPIVATSARSGTGIEELKAALLGACERVEAKQSAEPFRLAVDRAFVSQGHGTVVTGTVSAGAIAVGDELDWHKGHGAVESVRVRALHNHGRPVDDVRRGQRAAINLAGVPIEEVARGQVLATTSYLVPSKVLTVRLRALADSPRAIRHRLPTRLHIGTAEVMATTSVLDLDQIDPGKWAIAQLFLAEPVAAVWGQPFVLRDSSAEHTLGGGQVLQPVATKLRRRHLASLERVEQLWADDPAIRAAAAGWFAGFDGFKADDLTRTAGIGPDALGETLARLIAGGKIVELVLPHARRLLMQADRVAELETRILDVLSGFHAENPLATNHERGKVLSRLDYVGDEALLQAVTDRLIKRKAAVGDARRVAQADFKPKLSANQRKLKDRIVEDHRAAGFQPPEPQSYVNHTGGNLAALKDIFEVACAEGHLVRVTNDIYLHADADAEMRRAVAQRLRAGPGATVAEIRDLLGTSRKYAVPFCEYLDQIRVTKREGDLRLSADVTANQ